MSIVLNSGGNHPSFSAVVADTAGSGLVITVASAATAQVIKGAAFAQAKNNTAGGLVWVAADGVLTVTKDEARGRYLAMFSATDVIGVSAKHNSLTVWAKQAGAAIAAVGAPLRFTERATAVREGRALLMAEVSLTEVGDTCEIRVGVETDTNAFTIRGCALELIKIGE